MKGINEPDTSIVRIAGIEIINSVKAIASVFTEILMFMAWFPTVVYGGYRVVIVLWDDSLKPQSLMGFIDFIMELYSFVIPSLAIIAVALIVVLFSFKAFSKVWRKSC
ncbi:hypothetical protein DV511_23705 [Salmonella enterica subsp. enterica serovar Enteritidis]|uniref:hypothetical protein n=1 Tax=Enterobacteriaceae TaxID=543 RepID=UPI000F45DFE2|nr:MULTISPECIES: hypothetical protein [Enterobacteriaceae]MBH8402657.1 hypothetical protein [Klebsiella pneumoniae]RNM44898.1 hypothetical protein D9761_18890 [Salmonella enterica]TYG28779.1 hypothetical protein DV511_23705 [Salmonella enterica subsp. enterica serovar Enteritidis]